jgi:putative acetyltransferase
MESMTVIVRPLRLDETRIYLEVHHAAIRGIAAADYPADVIEAWAPTPITDDVVQQVMANAEDEIRLAALVDGEVAGIGAVIPRQCELRACYVAPGAARRKLGNALVQEMERIARAHRAAFLALDSSVTAERFYLQLGYRALERGTHALTSGCLMTCIKMRKDL